jgi:hypothetical protein
MKSGKKLGKLGKPQKKDEIIKSVYCTLHWALDRKLAIQNCTSIFAIRE